MWCVLQTLFFRPLPKSLLAGGRFWNTFFFYTSKFLLYFIIYCTVNVQQSLHLLESLGILINRISFLVISSGLSIEYAQLGCLWAFGSSTGDGACYWCGIPQATIALLFIVLFHCSCLLRIHLWTGWALNNALVWSFVLITVTNLLCVLKTVTYVTWVFSSVRLNLFIYLVFFFFFWQDRI